MKRLKIYFPILILSLIFVLIFWQAFFVFFTQDDYILISEFSKKGVVHELLNVFGTPKVTHWRPGHNLYFFIAGNLFDKNYFFYHLFGAVLGLIAAFFIFLIIDKIIKNRFLALFGALIYISNSSHFTSLAWIAGDATWVGFMFLISSFYSFICRKDLLSLMLFAAALLTSEAMLAGLILFLIWSAFIGGKREKLKIVSAFLLTSVIFLIAKFLLTSKVTYDIYKVSISFSIFSALKYYILRILNFGEIDGDLVPSFLLVAFYLIITFVFIRNFSNLIRSKIVIMGVATTIAGLFPFILLKDHLSPNYMNISIVGFSLILVGTLVKENTKLVSFLLSLYVISSVFTARLSFKDNWVVKRSILAKAYIVKLESKKLPTRSTIIFSDNKISFSSEAYHALGAGKAIDFWFPEKAYTNCFTAFDKCQLGGKKTYVFEN